MNNKELLAGYLDRLKNQNRSEKTIKSYIETLEQFDKFIRKSFLEVNQTDIESFIGQKKSSSTKNRVQVTINRFYQWLVNTGKLNRNPFIEKLKFSKPKRDPKKLTDNEMDSITTYCKKNLNQRDQLIISVLAGTGIRNDEVLNVKVENIDFINECLTIVGKGDKERRIFFSKALSNKIQRYCEKNNITNGYLFRNLKGGQLSKSHLANLFREIKNGCGLKEFFPHMLRSNYATRFIENDGELLYLSELMGHANLQTTKLYVKINDKCIKDSVNKCVKIAM